MAPLPHRHSPIELLLPHDAGGGSKLQHEPESLKISDTESDKVKIEEFSFLIADKIVDLALLIFCLVLQI